MRTALGKGSGDAWRRPEIHVGDSHRDLDVVAERRNRIVPFATVRADPIIDLIEVIRLTQRRVGNIGRWRRRRGFGTDRARDCRDPRTLQERSAI